MKNRVPRRLVNFKLTRNDEARLKAIREKAHLETAAAALRLSLSRTCESMGISLEGL